MILMDDVAQLGSMCFEIYAQRVPRDGDGSKDDDEDDAGLWLSDVSQADEAELRRVESG